MEHMVVKFLELGGQVLGPQPEQELRPGVAAQGDVTLSSDVDFKLGVQVRFAWVIPGALHLGLTHTTHTATSLSALNFLRIAPRCCGVAPSANPLVMATPKRSLKHLRSPRIPGATKLIME